MKKLVNMLMFAAALMVPFAAGARNVSEQEAREAAAYYMERNTLVSGVKVSDLVLVHQYDNAGLGVPAIYVYNVGDWGWVMMTATTAFSPVVAFGVEGNLREWDELPPAMLAWLDVYSDAVSDVQMQDVEGKFDDLQQWLDLFGHTMTYNAKDGDDRIILMNEHWEQGENRNPTYNRRCPYDSTSRKYTYTGCVATAMAQIMHYYGFPKAGTGGRVIYTASGLYPIKLKFDSLRFDYSAMPNRLTSYSSTNQVNEVARLNFAAGVSVHMNYGVTGSGAHSEDVPNAMANYFRYQRGTLTARSSTTTNNFLDILRSDLMLRRPVYMSGASSSGGGADAAGHAWVCCGYRTEHEDQYYMNWGWGSSGDGFFDLRANTSIVPSGYSYNFNVGQDIITGIIPPHADSSDVDFLTAIDPVRADATLLPAFPNPAVHSVTLPYTSNAAAVMQVFSIDGRLVATRGVGPGSGSVVIDVTAMPVGIYIYRLGGRSGKFIKR